MEEEALDEGNGEGKREEVTDGVNAEKLMEAGKGHEGA